MIKKRVISLVLVLFMVLSLFPSNLSVYAEEAEEEETNMAEMDALSALGIDSSQAPEGFDENDQSNPYGKDTITMNPVSELYVVGLDKKLVLSPWVYGKVTDGDINIDNQALKGTLYGHNDYSSETTEEIMNNKTEETIASGNSSGKANYIYLEDNGKSYLQSNGSSINTSLSSSATGDFSIAASKVAKGNFDGNEEGKYAQSVLLYTGELDKNGGLYMRIGDSNNGQYGDAIELIPTSKVIGNSNISITEDGKESKINENFVTDPYLMQNYMQVTTGDYDGDGIDEIAVFVPQYGESKIVVYKFKEKTNQPNAAYRNASQWEIEWTYSLLEKNYVSNMVSLVSGDFNEDGVDDLGATWGYYFGHDLNNGSKAVVMFGSRDKMLQDSQEFSLKDGESEIVRASFTFGDLTGGGETLVLGGQYDRDIRNGIQSRYVALYNWNGTSFVSNTTKNFDLFAYEEDDNGDKVYENPAMSVDVKKDGEGKDVARFYSSSLCPANLAVVSQGLSESAYLYLDSLKIQYGDNGLEISAPLDQIGANQGNNEYYVEYGAVSGDLVGLGYDTIITMQQTMSTDDQIKSTSEKWYYKNWWHRWIRKKTYYTVETGDCNMFTPSKTYMVVRDFKANDKIKRHVDSSTSVCLQNTDNDTSFMQYTGEHYFTYTDPEVLAVLASPPYFADLLNRDDLSGSYAESTTSYSSTKGSGGGDTFNSTIEAGTYVSVEQEFSVFGVTVASAEAEASITAGFTYETESTCSLEQTISYNATAGEDMVAFFSIPMEIYEYDAYTLNKDGEYVKQKMTVNKPHIAAVQLLSLEDYENIAKDYDVLPQISGTVLKHKLGDLSTYDSSESGYLNALKYNGHWSRVGFSSNDGGASIAQEIAMSKEKTTSYSVSSKIETKAGAGAGGVKVGVTFGAEVGFGSVTTSTEGNSFSGEMQNMPIEAQEYGYGYCWKIFSYLYDDGRMSFPIVDYLVDDVTAPAPLPTDFEQNVEKTTDADIAFTWTYDKMVAGFQIYRYYEFPDGSGSYELKFVPMSDGTYNSEDGLYHFEFIDEGLSPYTDYQYQIQTVRSSVPNNSIPSQVISARTKTNVGYPKFSLSGLDDGFIRIYPDSISTVSAEILNADNYGKNIDYQWQKLVDGVWTDMPGRTSEKLTFKASGASDQGSYRCRSNVIYYDKGQGNNYYISAYSDVFETKYSKRTPVKNDFEVTTFKKDDGGKGVNIELELVSGNLGHYIAPTGIVTYTVSGTDYNVEHTVKLIASDDTNGDDKHIARANLDLLDLPNGVYEVSAYYGGNRVFKSYSTVENETFLVGESGYQLLLQNDSIQSVEYIYGDEITPILQYLTKNEDGSTNIEDINTDVTYQIKRSQTTYDGKFGTPNVGNYTLLANLSGSGIVAQRDFSVLQREITIEAKKPVDNQGNEVNVGKGEVTIKPPTLEITEGSMAFDEELSDLNLTISAINTAGKDVVLNDKTDPGNYTIIGESSDDTDDVIYNNYKIKYVSGIYTIIGQTYDVKINAEQYQGLEAGTIALSNTEDGLGAKFSSGTDLLFYATPYKGYEVNEWSAFVIKPGNKLEPIDLDGSQNGKSKFSLKLKADDTKVTVSFKKAQTTLTTAMEGQGVITCDSDSFKSGGIVNTGADITFTATPDEGYIFKKWKIECGGLPSEKDGTLNPDGSNTLTHIMGAANTTLRAVFERESYTITLADNLEAVYEYETGDIENPTAEKIVYSGDEIVGDKEVLVKPRAGYEVTEGAEWTANGTTVAAIDDYTFNITEDTTILVDTTQLSLNITKIEENGIISVNINEEDTDDITGVPGGSKVVFTAHPAHGYEFDSYELTVSPSGIDYDTDKYTTAGAILTIEELGSDITIKANYTKSTDYEVNVICGNKANVTYTLYDAFDKLVEKDTVDSGHSIDVCDEDDITLTINPDKGYMVDKWTITREIDGEITKVVDDTSNKKYTFNDISSDIDVKVDIISKTSYKVNYGVDGGHGIISSATYDNKDFDSGFEDVGGNSEVVITSVPEANYMVDHWTINGNTVLNESGSVFVGKVLTIDSLTPDNTTTVDIKVYFTDQVDHTVTFEETNVDISPEYTPDDASTLDVRDGAKGIFTITPDDTSDDSYRVYDAVVIGDNITEDDYTIVKNEDSDVDDYGTWTLTIDEINENITVSAIAKEIHTLNIDTVDGGDLSSETTTSYDTKAIEGETIIITQDADLDYTFKSWNVTDENGKINVNGNIDDGFSFEMPDNDVTISAVFVQIDTVDINYNVYDKNDIEDGGHNGTLSATITREDISGYPKTVVEDKTDGSIANINRGYDDDYVNWPMSKVKFTATPDDGYKVFKWTIDGKAYYSSLKLPNSTGSMNELILNIEQVTKDIVVIVQFEPIGDQITYKVEGDNGSIISAINEYTQNDFISGNTVSYETNISFEAKADEGYEVEAWLVDGSVAKDGPNNTFTYKADGVNGADIAVKFAKLPFMVNYSGENGTITCNDVENGGKVRGDTDITFTVKADPGYKFDSYTVEGSTYTLNDDNSLTVTVTKDTVVTANFIKDENCEVTYSVVGDNGSLEAIKDNDTFNSGDVGAANDVIIFTATPDTNYKVKSWTVDEEEIDSDDKTYELTVSKSSHNVSVEFERSHYVVDFDVIGENGTISAINVDANINLSTGDSLEKGEDIRFTAVPKDGYQVKQWKLNGEKVLDSEEKLTCEINNLSEDSTVTVEFEEIPSYDITIIVTGVGQGTYKAYVNDIETSVDGNKITVKNHDEVKFIATPKDEYNTAVWSTDNLTNCEIKNINISSNDVTSNATITVSFNVAELMTVKADAVKANEADESANGTISAKAGYEGDLRIINAVDSEVKIIKGKTVEFTATPAEGYMVKKWIVDGEDVDNLTHTLTRVPDTNITVGVVYEPILAHKLPIPIEEDNYSITEIDKIPDLLPDEYDDSIRDRGTVTFTLAPNNGYYFDQVIISGVDCLTETGSDEGTTENIVNVVDNEDGSYTITVSNVKNKIVDDSEDTTDGINPVKPIISIEEVQFGEIKVTYEYIDDNDETQIVDVTSGDSIAVGTKLIVKGNADVGYKFKAWGEFAKYKKNNPITITVPNDNLVITGSFYKGSSSHSSGGGGSSLPPVVEEDPVMKAVEEAKKDDAGKKIAVIETKKQNKDKEYEQEIPKEFFKEKDTVLEVITPEGTVSLPNDMFEESIDKDVQISIDRVDSSKLDLPEEFKDKPVIDINLKIGGKKTKWNSKDKEITVSIPYKLSDEEKQDPHKVIAVYIDDDGNITPLKNSDYDPETGAIVFKTKHTSYYSVQYIDKSFEDIGTYTWAEESIDALAARGIINGLPGNKFAPQNYIKRADFVVLITRFFGFENTGETNFDDVVKGEYYYDAIATAKELGIINGSGDNKFRPLEFISRQDMMVIIDRALKIADLKDKLNNETDLALDDFTDKENVSSHAIESIDYFIRKGIVSGNNMKINPKSKTKRAEVAVLLYRLLGQL